jgi:hypothetical protein
MKESQRGKTGRKVVKRRREEEGRRQEYGRLSVERI